MDRKNFYFRQIVGESDLDAAFTDVENALKDLVVSQELTGIVTGYEVSNPSTSPYQVDVSAGVAFSKSTGRRMTWGGGTVSLLTDEDSNAILLPLTTDGDVLVLSLFAKPVYIESDSRTDGNGNSLYYVRTEDVTLVLEQGTLGDTTATPAPTVPATRADQVLIADIIIYRVGGSDFIKSLSMGKLTVLM